jgi:peptidoglycan/LPS O-acetylase OafA/YrhL
MPKNNAFDLLRIILATLVLASHAFIIGGYGSEPFITFTKNQTYLGQIGVIGFFGLSGYLITGSFENNPRLVVFIWHRVLRILPGFWVCLIITAFLIAPLIYIINNNLIQSFPFFGNNGSLSYCINNSLLAVRQWNIDSILAKSNYKESFNGSLWTLFAEFQCYIVTAIFGLLGLINKNRKTFVGIWLLLYIVFVINIVLKTQYGPTFIILSNAFPLYLSYLSGSLLLIYKDKLSFDNKEVIFLSFLSALLLRYGGFLLAAPILIPILCITIFSRFKVRLKYDISYGLYIYGFPIEQLLSRFLGTRVDFLIYLIACFALSCLLGLLSNKFIEKPLLKFKDIFSKSVA